MLEIKSDMENSVLDLVVYGTFEDVACEAMAAFDAITESLSEQDEVLSFLFMNIMRDYMSKCIEDPAETARGLQGKEEIKIDVGAMELMKQLLDENNDIIDHEAERLEGNE